MKKVKILIIAKLPPPFIGPTLANEIILNSSIKNEYEIIHLDSSDHRDISTLAKLDFTNYILAIKQYLLLFAYIVRYQPKVVYFPNAQTTVAYLRDLPILLISKLLGKKVIGHLRGGNFRNWYNSTSKLMQVLVKTVHPLFNAQIVLGENLRPLFNWLLPDDRIFVVPNGADYKYSMTDRIKSEEIKILYLANFIPSKGVFDVLESIPYLNNINSNIKFIFAGAWQEESAKKRYDEFLNTHKGLPIEMKGKVTGSDKLRLIEQSDIFVFPTYYPSEGHPWVVIEAMAAGLPIVTCDHAAISQSVKDGINGFLVEKQNPQKIAEKIELLINDEELRRNMGKKSRSLYEKYFTEEKMIDNLKNVFNQVIKDY